MKKNDICFLCVVGFIVSVAVLIQMCRTVTHSTPPPLEKASETEFYVEEMEEVLEIITETQTEIQTKEPPYKTCSWLGIELTKEDYELLCRTTYCESGNQDLETQYMVALTILNRVNSWKFPATISEVIYAENAYSVTKWYKFEEYGWTEQVALAVDMALAENRHPNNMFYFRTLHYHTFGKPYRQSDDLWFSLEE